MQLTPLRPRRRHRAPGQLDNGNANTAAATGRSADLSAVARRIAGLVDGPVTEALVVMLTELYGDAIARIVHAIKDVPDGERLLERLGRDQLVGGLLVVHDLHPHPLEARVDRALTAALNAAPGLPSVALERIEDDVVYVRLATNACPAARSAIVRAIAEAAPEISRVCAEVYPDEGRATAV